MTRATSALIAAAIAVSVALTGCTQQGTSPAPKPAQSTTAAATTQQPAPAVGDVIEPGTDLPKGQKGYVLADGTVIVVDKLQPLPQPVYDELAAAGRTIVQQVTDETVSVNDSHELRGSLIVDVARKTGKTAIIIWAVWGYPTIEASSAGEKVWFYTVQGGPGDGFTFYESRAEVEAVIAAFMADPANARFAPIWTD